MRRPCFHPKLRLWLLRLTLLGGAVAVSLLLVEVSVRTLLPQYHPQAQIQLQKLPNGMRLGPVNRTVRVARGRNYDLPVTFNALGLRDPKDLRTAPAEAWFAVGDSFTMGWGVPEEERFSSLLERQLGRPFYNLAIGDNDLRGYRHLVEYAEEKGGPVRRLVLGICMGNDLWNYQNTEPVATPPRTLRLVGATERLKRHSALFLAVWHQLQLHPRTHQWLAEARLISPVAMKYFHQPYDEAVLRSSRDEVLALARGREVVVVLIPSVGLWLPQDPATVQRNHTRFAGLLREAGLRVVDLQPRLERPGPALSAYFKTDPHWNAHGHQLAAEEIAEALGGGPVLP